MWQRSRAPGQPVRHFRYNAEVGHKPLPDLLAWTTRSRQRGSPAQPSTNKQLLTTLTHTLYNSNDNNNSMQQSLPIHDFYLCISLQSKAWPTQPAPFPTRLFMTCDLAPVMLDSELWSLTPGHRLPGSCGQLPWWWWRVKRTLSHQTSTHLLTSREWHVSLDVISAWA